MKVIRHNKKSLFNLFKVKKKKKVKKSAEQRKGCRSRSLPSEDNEKNCSQVRGCTAGGKRQSN